MASEATSRVLGTLERPTLVNALSIASIGRLGVEAKVANFRTPLAVFYGIIKELGFKRDPKTGAEYEPLVGDFIGINTQSGEIFRSGVLYLPSGIHDQVASPFKEGREIERSDSGDGRDTSKVKRDPKNYVPPMQFGVQIDAIPSSNKAGYTYQGSPIRDTSSTDPLLEMTRSLNTLVSLPENVMKQLPTPKSSDQMMIEHAETSGNITIEHEETHKKKAHA